MPLCLEDRLGRHAVSHGELVGITVLQVAHPLIPVVALQTAQVRPGHQRRVAHHFQLRLERKSLVTDNIGGWRAAIDQEHGNRSDARRKSTVLAITGDWAGGQDDAQAVAIGHIGLNRLLGALRQIEHDLFLPSGSLPADWPCLAWLGLQAVVTPSHDYPKMSSRRRHQHAQPNRRRHTPLSECHAA